MSVTSIIVLSCAELIDDDAIDLPRADSLLIIVASCELSGDTSVTATAAAAAAARGKPHM